jgi:hypothetical protein
MHVSFDVDRICMRKSASLKVLSVLFCVAIIQATALAGSVPITTGMTWAVTAGGTEAVNVTPFLTPRAPQNNQISVTTDGLPSGTFLEGGSAGAFNNYWTARFDFTLPPNAAD